MTWQLVVFLSVLFIWGTRVLADWLALREQRRELNTAAPPPEPKPHRCASADMVAIAAKPLTSDHVLNFHQTILLKRCKVCGAHATEGHPGCWTTDDFLKTQADIQWLKEQMG